MSELPQSSRAAGPGDVGRVRPFDASPAAVGVSLAIVAGTALLGVVAGYVWSLAAPRALLVIASPGAASLVHTETAAFIAADLIFCLIGLAGGVLSGALGYLLGVRRYGPLAMIGVLAGALVAALLALHIQFSDATGPWLYEYAVEWVPLLCLVFMKAGSVWGLDAAIARGNPRWKRLFA